MRTDTQVVQLQAAYDAAELATDDAAQAERAAFERWQDAMGAYEVARSESTAAWTAYAEAVNP